MNGRKTLKPTRKQNIVLALGAHNVSLRLTILRIGHKIGFTIKQTHFLCGIMTKAGEPMVFWSCRSMALGLIYRLTFDMT